MRTWKCKISCSIHILLKWKHFLGEEANILSKKTATEVETVEINSWPRPTSPGAALLLPSPPPPLPLIQQLYFNWVKSCISLSIMNFFQDTLTFGVLGSVSKTLGDLDPFKGQRYTKNSYSVSKIISVLCSIRCLWLISKSFCLIIRILLAYLQIVCLIIVL